MKTRMRRGSATTGAQRAGGTLPRIAVAACLLLGLKAMPAQGAITLAIDDANNSVTVTGAATGTAVAIRGTLTNTGSTNYPSALTAVLFREVAGDIAPADLSLSWWTGPTGWQPAGPQFKPTNYPGYHMELNIGGGGLPLPPFFVGAGTWIRSVANRDLGTVEIKAIAYADGNSNSRYDVGEAIISEIGGIIDTDIQIDLLGFDLATVLVDDDWAGCDPGNPEMNIPAEEVAPDSFCKINAFDRIQHGIDAVYGTTVNVAAGSYTENLTVAKPLNLAGAGQGSSIVRPAISDPLCPSPSSLCGSGHARSNIVLVEADDVTIHGFTLDGDNPALTSGVVRRGADLDARNGIIENYYAGLYNNLEVYNVSVQNTYLRGIYPSSGGESFHIHDNIVDNVQGEPESMAIMCWNGTGIIENNTVSNSNGAIVCNWSRGTQYLNNTVTNCLNGIHTDNAGRWDPNALGLGDDLLRGNAVSDCAPGGYGVFTFEPGIAPRVEGNTITNCDVGLSAEGGEGTGAVFADNSVDGMQRLESVGVYVTTSLFGSGSADVSATFTGNIIRNTDVGFLLQDKTCTTNTTTGCAVDEDCPDFPSETCDVGYTLTLNATCNRLSGNGTGILAEALTAPANVVFSDNLIAGNTVGANGTAIAAGSIIAEDNWWGAVDGPGGTGPGSGDPVTTHVDFDPFATSVPACVSCSRDAECDDGLTCNGTEICNPGTELCESRTPVDCSGQCKTGACEEPAGTCEPVLDGTNCDTGRDTCSHPDSCESSICQNTGGGGDTDGDEVCDSDDTCPEDATPNQEDADSDYHGDACDNCPDDANSGQEDFDNDDLGDICDGNDVAGLSLRKVRTRDHEPGRARYSVLGELDATPNSTFVDDVDTRGITVILETTTPPSEVNAFAFGSADCLQRNGSINCREPATGSALRLKQRPAPLFFRVQINVKRTKFVNAPTAAKTPLAVRLQTADQRDRRDEIGSCTERHADRLLLCRELP